MKFLFRTLRRLLTVFLGVLLVALLAAGITFGWQGYKLYQNTLLSIPMDTLYESISSRPSFTPYRERTAASPTTTASTRFPSFGPSAPI